MAVSRSTHGVRDAADPEALLGGPHGAQQPRRAPGLTARQGHPTSPATASESAALHLVGQSGVETFGKQPRRVVDIALCEGGEGALTEPHSQAPTVAGLPQHR